MKTRIHFVLHQIVLALLLGVASYNAGFLVGFGQWLLEDLSQFSAAVAALLLVPALGLAWGCFERSGLRAGGGQDLRKRLLLFYLVAFVIGYLWFRWFPREPIFSAVVIPLQVASLVAFIRGAVPKFSRWVDARAMKRPLVTPEQP